MKKNRNFDKGSEVRKVAAKTCLKKYGAENWMQSEEGRKAVSENVKEQWRRIKEQVQFEEEYTFEETKQILEANNYWQTLLGKAKNRTLLKEDPRLYRSIYKHSEVLEQKMKESKKYVSSYNFSHRIRFIVEKEGQIEALRCSCGKAYSWTGHCRHCSDLKDTYSRISESRKEELLRQRRIKFGQRNIDAQRCPMYNLGSIVIIETFAKKHGWKMQHAEKGGEFCVQKLGYWIDAYDSENNIALEIDEPAHFSRCTLSARDIKRQEAIEKELGCKFYRIYYNKMTNRVVLYHTPEIREWNFNKGEDLTEVVGKNKNGTVKYSQYGV